jgi:hypothetical protein
VGRSQRILGFRLRRFLGFVRGWGLGLGARALCEPLDTDDLIVRLAKSGAMPAIAAIAVKLHRMAAAGTVSDRDGALLAASKLATGDGARLTIVTVVALERPIRRVTRLPMLTGVWNDILIDRARADLERADRLLNMPPERTGAVRFSNPSARGRRRGIRARRDPAANPAVWAAREAAPA